MMIVTPTDAIEDCDLQLYHQAGKLLEGGSDLQYQAGLCRMRYGYDWAGFLVVRRLRKDLNLCPNQWPPPDDLIPKVNDVLPLWINPTDAIRFHAGNRMIEDDMDEAYFSCRRKFGKDIAGLLLVAHLRQIFRENDSKEVTVDVKKFLVEKRLAVP